MIHIRRQQRSLPDRTFYTGYNDTHYERTAVNPQVTKFIVKTSLSLAVSVLIGALIKSERNIAGQLDALLTKHEQIES